ncbi:MAG: hypothetical protein GW939_04200 [Candidatus Magasanikbacteria bacterium]|uniref:Uncharacterized protein n=1 Tax=Candidatus Magasanikbacteria bacterium CG10_big_fil_rev_8_21_14_0_10_38_6 TaxID=1974647 RepID=A0A2M6P0W4_9BACT|nr:hypothetical protein [Candidatus Magasanikbacteria bacterium]NCS72331.1 hypothetical protein [Candidatus Magasanikbacteria bacterium]PIR77356.1 MAG: hypothetical protein COU30_02880 [Candidatus Magasanikbacteria bacterium CG10_big_fil_rev_8_21_14_0_10_38_6]
MGLSRDYRRPFWRGLLHALLVVAYCVFISLVYLSIDQLYAGEIEYIVQIVFGLFASVVSIAICAYLIFYEPIKKLLKHHFRAASVMMMSTLGWLLIFVLIFLMGLVYTVT